MEYIQVGFTALRDPATGGYLPSVPLFIEGTPEAIAGQEALTQDVARLFAHRLKAYEDGLRKEGLK